MVSEAFENQLLKKSFYIYETDKINQNEIFKRIKNEISIIPVVDKKKK